MPRINIEEFRSRLVINKHDLDGETEVHAQSLERIGREVAGLSANVLQAKEQLERIEVKCLKEVRERYEKISVAEASSEARTLRAYTDAFGLYLTAKSEHEEWVALYDAWKSRGFNLRVLADLHGQQYFAVTSLSGRTSYIKEHDREADARRAMREAADARRAQRGHAVGPVDVPIVIRRRPTK